MTNTLPRRRLLKLGIGGAVLLTASGFALRWFSAGYDRQLTQGEVPIALSGKELAIVKAYVAALLPADDALPSGVALGIHQRIDEELWAASSAVRNDAKAGLQLFEHAPLLNGFGARFTALEPDAQRAYVGRALVGTNDALRQIASALKQLSHLLYYARPEVWKAIGYDGPWVPTAVPPDSHIAYQDLLKRKRSAA